MSPVCHFPVALDPPSPYRGLRPLQILDDEFFVTLDATSVAALWDTRIPRMPWRAPAKCAARAANPPRSVGTTRSLPCPTPPAPSSSAGRRSPVATRTIRCISIISPRRPRGERSADRASIRRCKWDRARSPRRGPRPGESSVLRVTWPFLRRGGFCASLGASTLAGSTLLFLQFQLKLK